VQATIVFEKIWQAINAKNEDGSRKYRYIINTGSSRSSKTYSILQSHHLTALLNPNKRVSIWRETKQDVKNTVLADLKKAFTTFPQNENVVFNITESIYKYTNGSTIEICGGDDTNRVHGFQGDVAHFNEPYKMPKDVFDQIDMRTSDYVIIDWNPKSHHWIDQLSKQDNAIVIHSTFRDNPFVPEQQRLKILSYEPNDFNIEQGTANEWMWQVYGLGLKAERPNRIYHWNKITRSEYDALDCHVMYAVDWGKVDPFSIVEMKLYDQTVYIRELNYLSENEIKANATPEELAQMFHNVGLHEDEQYNQDTGVVLWLFNKLGLKRNAWMICDNNRPLKRDACRRAGWENIEDTIKQGMKVDSISMVQNVNICYTDDSPNIEYEHENYSWKVDRYGVTLEEPEEKDDHHMDSIRYGVLKLISEGLIRITV
jgi:phage terminase large subunit